MLILILVDIQYLQSVAFGFKKGSDSQNHSRSDSHRPNRKFSDSKISYPPPPPSTQRYYKTLSNVVRSLIKPKKKQGNKKSSEGGDWQGGWAKFEREGGGVGNIGDLDKIVG